jgi:hypothetical protein
MTSSALTQTIFPTTEDHSYGQSFIDNKCTRDAIMQLSGGAFKLYMYARTCMNTFPIKPDLYAKMFRIKMRTVQSYFAELIAKKYARRIVIKDNKSKQIIDYLYQFFESPEPDAENLHRPNFRVVKKTEKNKQVTKEKPPAENLHLDTSIIEVAKIAAANTDPEPIPEQQIPPPATAEKPAAAVIDFEIVSELKSIGYSRLDDIKNVKAKLGYKPNIDAWVKKYVLEAIAIARTKDNPAGYLNNALRNEPYESILNRIETREKLTQKQTVDRQKAIEETKAAQALANRTVDFQSEHEQVIDAFKNLPNEMKDDLFDEYLSTIKNEMIRIKTKRKGVESALVTKPTFRIWLEKRLNDA